MLHVNKKIILSLLQGVLLALHGISHKNEAGKLKKGLYLS
jgi:hypothetical protein